MHLFLSETKCTCVSGKKKECLRKITAIKM